MDNKDEKTFADLFSSIDNNDKEDISDNEVTNFDSLATDLFSNNNDFNDKNDSVVNNSLEVNENDNDNSVTFDNFLSNFNEERVEDNVTENVEKNSYIKDANNLMDVLENQHENNLFFDDTSNLDNKDMAIDKQMEQNIENKDDVGNLFFNSEDSLGQSNDIKNEVNPFFDDNKVDNNINDDTFIEDNPFLSDKQQDSEKNDVQESDNHVSLDSKQDVEVINPFFDNNKKEEVVSNNNEQINNGPINQLLIENEKNKSIKDQDDKVVSESISPFFQNSDNNFEKIEENILGNKISFDQTMKVNSKLDKIDFNGTKNFNVKLVKKKVPLMKFLIGVVSYAFFIFLVLILVTLLAYVLDIKIRAAKGDYSAPTFNAYVVLTGSMLPEIQVKDVVVTKKVEANALKVGDIITFASSDSRFAGTIITHRILKKNQDADGNITFQTKGDNNNVADSALVQPNNIYGKVILKIPKLGYLQDFLATQGGWIIVILLPCATVISYDILKLVKGIKRRKNKIKVIK